MVLAFACIAAAQSSSIDGIVHPSLPPFEFLVHYENTEGVFAEGFEGIDRIEVRSGGRHIQTIGFEGEDPPLITASWGEAVSLQDVDCDGYKDLLVRANVGAHGDAWYHLYRFNPKRGAFEEYLEFSSLPFKSVDCSDKVVKTYVNSGAAGCAYESGTYRWVDGELLPVRIESQEAADRGFTRTVRSWSDGKETVTKQSIGKGDCHRAN